MHNKVPEWCVEGAECDFWFSRYGMSDHVRIIYVESPYTALCKSLKNGEVHSYAIMHLSPTKSGKDINALTKQENP